MPAWPEGADMRGTAFFAVAALFVATPSFAAPAYLSRHETSADDLAAIQTLLTTYTTSVTNHDEAAFEALLLNEQVPFSSVSGAIGAGAAAPPDTQRYADFRKAIFAPGARYSQQFYNVHIEQDGGLAQVALDFVTKDEASGRAGYGWKTIQLLKVQGRWKIASEFYTGRSVPNAS
jgi:hypothetical protein